LGRTGAGQDEINLRIQQSPEYAQRFAGNATRLANGLSVLDPATYIALESQYRQILNDLPTGFYDSKADIDGLIGNNVSPSELSDKVQLANQYYINAAPEWRQAYDTYYGSVGVGGAIASILDPTRAEDLIQQQVTASAIGGTALQQGLNLTSAATAGKAAQQGVTLQQAQQAYQQIAQQHAAYQSISGRFTAGINQGIQEQAQLLGNASALNQERLAANEESAQFGGHGGSSAQANSPGNNY
jgi:hypothetical protein